MKVESKKELELIKAKLSDLDNGVGIKYDGRLGAESLEIVSGIKSMITSTIRDIETHINKIEDIENGKVTVKESRQSLSDFI